MTLIEIIKEHHVTDTEGYTPEPEAEHWVEPDGVSAEPKHNPHNHRFTITVGGPSIVVRAESGAELIEALRDLETSGAYQAIAYAVQQAAAYKPQPTAPTPPPQIAAPAAYGAPAPAPNQPYPGQPAWQQAGPPAPQAPAAPQGGRAGTPVAPPGWYRINVPFPAKEQFGAYRKENGQAFAGKIKWSSGGIYFIAPDVAQYFQQYGPTPA